MVEIRPFKAIRYTEKAGDMKNLITQPYDKIDREMQEKYYKASEYNYCRLILPIEEDRYNIAKERLNSWLNEGVLKKDETPALYVYFQEFEVLGEKYIRKGFISAVKLHPYEENVVLPHEKTHKGPKIDRLNMLRATLKNLEPGFMLYSDPKKETIKVFEELAKTEPMIDVIDEYGVRNKIWKLEDPEKIKIVQKVLKPEQIVIADGHHRYETAVSFRDELREKHSDWTEDDAFNFRMTLLVPVEDEGLVVLPSHRVLLKHSISKEHIDEIRKYFDVEELSRNDVKEYLKKHQDKITFVMYDGKQYLGMILKDIKAVDKFLKPEYSEHYKQLDVVILRDVIFEGIMNAKGLKIHEDIDYIRWLDDAIQWVDDGKAKVTFLLNATKPEQVLKIAKNHEKMPEKSTDFYPKMVSGITMMDITPGEKLPK